MTGKKQPDEAQKKPAAKKAPAAPAKNTAKRPPRKGQGNHNPKKPKAPTQAAKDAAIKAPKGRPTTYTEDNEQKVLIHLATGGSMNQLKEMEGYPYPSTVYEWIFKHEDFREKYIAARAIGMFAWAEDCIDIADDGSNDYMEKLNRDGEQIGWQVNGEYVQRSRLRVNTRQWYMERINAKVFGDKKQIDHGVTEEGALGALLQSVSGNTLKPKPQGDED